MQENLDISQGLARSMVEISHDSNDQARNIEEISVSMSNIDRKTQENVASSEESAAAAEQLFAQAEQMNEFMQKLQSVLDGNARTESFSNGELNDRASSATSPRCIGDSRMNTFAPFN
ncbi:hypothetical protein [Pelagicoccus sp. SDUM812002]|uniref:hypothetical protein n=1 Tax=Pelagicoccus sp. SDUM812002 TaxID=3041266 RepID=UPI00280C689B|nr:hypothetical protein [Pelagicoccus sp. SDUM812002]MDQ8187910.1 hypothetical protein [Pelagicoccus sp. SDUM812002]